MRHAQNEYVSARNAANRARSPLTTIEVIPAAPEQEPILANLLELYVHDFSEFLDIELGEDGRFGYADLPRYWREIDRHPFLVRIDGRWGGFALVRKGSANSGNAVVWDMVEFFVVRRYRRLGIGTRIAHEAWRRFPGKWEIRVMQSNDSARRFWEHAIEEFAGHEVQSSRFEKNGAWCTVFSFEAIPPVPRMLPVL
jgi:predicted acetyltransferase